MLPVLEYLKQNEQRSIDQLCEYVRFPSVSAQPQHKSDLHSCAEWVLKHCQDMGLEARLCPTEGHPIVIAKNSRNGRLESTGMRARAAKKPHFLIYGHYDVQPPEPFELWKTPPFEPRIEGRTLFGRGSSDNKGQHLAHLNAVEAYLKTGTELP